MERNMKITITYRVHFMEFTGSVELGYYENSFTYSTEVNLNSRSLQTARNRVMNEVKRRGINPLYVYDLELVQNAD